MTRPPPSSYECRCPAHEGRHRFAYNDSGCRSRSTCASQPTPPPLAPHAALFLNYHGGLRSESRLASDRVDWRHAAPVLADRHFAASTFAQLLHTTAAERRQHLSSTNPPSFGGRRASHAERAHGPFFVAQKGHHAMTMTKTITGIIAIAFVACIGVPMLLLSAVLGGSGGCTPPIPNASGQPGIGRWDREQVSIAATIIGIGVAKGVPRWGRVVALATAMQESQLRNLPHLGQNSDHDSIGVFQQRPSQGWGTPQQLADPAYQAGKFYDKLLTIAGWQQMPLTEAAQQVQVSAYGSEYAKWTDDAVHLADALASVNATASPGTADYCGATGTWTQPVLAFVVSGFRTSERPGHDGVDLAAVRGTPIRAASAGVVVRVRCDIEPESYGCDRDGSLNTPGCGYYVDIEHPGKIYSRYCHMLTEPYVAVGDQAVAGQVIGLVGSSGHSSGPHLHFEIHLGDQSEATAKDPVPFMASQGAPLGQPVL